MSQSVFTDINLEFLNNSQTGIYKITDESAIKQSLEILINGGYYERLFHPEIGCSLGNLLFEQMTSFTEICIKRIIEDTINNYEPRIALKDVDVVGYPTSNSYKISVNYFINNFSTSISTFTFILERVR